MLSPKVKKLHELASGFRKIAKRLNSKLVSTKQRLREAEKFANSPEYLKAKLNNQTYNFVMSQIRHQHIPPKGRRFTLEDKIFSLSLFKQSPRGYKLLEKIFALPSRKTLTNLLRQVPLEPGINEAMFTFLKETSERLEPIFCYCTIIFDEMSIEPSLYYNEGCDSIEGFQDLGTDKRKPVFADKVMVFMARGVCKKWKQPLAYFFVENGMTSDVLVVTLKDIIRHCRAAGLKVGVVCNVHNYVDIFVLHVLFCSMI